MVQLQLGQHQAALDRLHEVRRLIQIEIQYLIYILSHTPILICELLSNDRGMHMVQCMRMQAEQVEAQLSAQQRTEEAELLARLQSSDGAQVKGGKQAPMPAKRTTRCVSHIMRKKGNGRKGDGA